jgi:hypothetical protein
MFSSKASKKHAARRVLYLRAMDHHTSLSARDISSTARGAGLAFMNYGRRWGAAELSTWLKGPYARLTKEGAESDGGIWGGPRHRSMEARFVEGIVKSARAEILAALRRPSKPFVRKSIDAGFIVACKDAAGETAWVLTGDATRLADRVLALFAIDALMRPTDYESNLRICPSCDAISFSTFPIYGLACCQRSAPMTMPPLTMRYEPFCPISAA